MNLKDLSIEELELMSYTDITYMLLKENKKTMNTPTIFKKICELLDYGDSFYEEKIGDYYTSLTLDKRFVLLEDNTWDIRDNHSVKMEIDEEEDADEEEENDEVEDNDDEIIDDVVDDENILDDDTDLDDLSIVEDEELEDSD